MLWEEDLYFRCFGRPLFVIGGLFVWEPFGGGASLPGGSWRVGPSRLAFQFGFFPPFLCLFPCFGSNSLRFSEKFPFPCVHVVDFGGFVFFFALWSKRRSF